MKSRLLPILMAGMIALLGACSTAPAAPPPAATQLPAPAATPVPASESATASETVNVTDARGTAVTVPANPQRIVTLSELDLDAALALGLKPVGSVNGRGQTGLPAYLNDKAGGIVSVGTLAEPSLEKIVALQPDVILAGAMIPQIEALLPELSKIAPVVATYKRTDDWKTAFKQIAGMLNQSAKADAFMADYDQRAAAVKASLPADKPAEANVVRWMPQGPVVMMAYTFSSRVLADAGLGRPAGLDELAGEDGAHSDPISLEKLDLIDAEWLFWGALNPDGAAALETALKNPLVQQMNAVKNNHVAQVDGAVWTSVGGPLAAMVILDDIANALKAE